MKRAVIMLSIFVACAGFAGSALREASAASRTAKATREVKVYLVAVGDEGKAGRKIGCGDSLVPVTRRINTGGAALKATIRELLLIPKDYNEQLKNFWQGRNLRVRSVVLRGGVATIHLSGEGPAVAGVCDEPRITSQIEQTARQFPNVRRVKVFVNGRTLASVIR